MSDWYILDENDNPVKASSVFDGAQWIESNRDKRQVALDGIGGVRISTVFLGLDHSLCDGAPVLYETMVFGGVLDMEQDRYCTRSSAIAGHKDMVRRVKAELFNTSKLDPE